MSYLRNVVDLHDKAFQRMRIAFEHRLTAIAQGRATATRDVIARLESWHERLKAMEDEVREEIEEEAANFPIIEAMCQVKGVGLLTAGRVQALIGPDISEFDTVSKLWRWAGYAVVDGKAERLKSGEKAHFSVRLKSACWRLAAGLMVHHDGYKDIYDRAKEKYLARGWTKLHADRAARRKMIKVWLSHLWETWRKMECLPTRDPYAHDYMGHTNHYRPKDFGWPVFGQGEEEEA